MNLVKPEHDKHWQPGEHTGTFRGQGISFVAGREALRYFEDDTLMQQTREHGKHMASSLQKIADKHSDKNFEVRGKGMIQALDVGNGELAKNIVRECFDNGLLIAPCGIGGRVLKLIPPLTIEANDLAEGLNLLSAAADTVLTAQ
jgi:diaminobutyrate-2-oxoglutarate transaminase